MRNVSVGIFRSDYMLHAGDASLSSRESLYETTLKQVEFNTFSCAGATHANKVANMHRYLTRARVYDVGETPFDFESLPTSHNIESLALCLALAHDTYGAPKSRPAKQTAVLFIVQPNNVRIFPRTHAGKARKEKRRKGDIKTAKTALTEGTVQYRR